VFTAFEADQANELVSKYASTGAMVYQDASTFATLALGTSGYPLLAGASAPAYGQVTATGIANDAVTTDKILNLNVTKDKMALALLKLLCPVGSISPYAGATAPTGWLLCDGTSTTGYTELIALVGATTPDLRGRVPLGKTASGTGSTLLGTGGARKIASGNLPTHAHSLDHDHAAFNYTHDHASFNTADGGAHTHTISDPGHVHTFSTDNNLATEFAGNAAFGNYNPDVNTNTSSAVTGISVTSTNSAHAHAIDVPSHTGSVDVPSFSGTVTTTFANDDFFEPFVSVNYIIKHDY
jgi:microcystin-dependent protein